MRSVSIVIIGDEILLGRVTDTNSGLIARCFSEGGWTVKSVRTVGDKGSDIEAAVRASLAESELVVTTGGLGPTRDDITKGVLMSVFGGEPEERPEILDNIQAVFAARGIRMNALTRTQATVPSSCRVIQNRLGTAPIMWFEADGHVLVAMPGVPYETRGMLPEVADAVRRHFGRGDNILHKEFTVTGISESALAEQLVPFEDALPSGVKLAYLPSPGEIVLRLDADGMETDAFGLLCDALKTAAAPYVVGEGRQTPAQLVLHRLRKLGLTLSSAESCTGGYIAHLITENAGCSDVFRGSVVSYANDVKIDVLGVAPSVLENEGAVSEATVEAMLAGVRRAVGADCAVATSGIAGPGGAVPGKPVGTVWIGAATPSRKLTRLCHFGGDRRAVIERAAAAALMLLLEIAE